MLVTLETKGSSLSNSAFPFIHSGSERKEFHAFLALCEVFEFKHIVEKVACFYDCLPEPDGFQSMFFEQSQGTICKAKVEVPHLSQNCLITSPRVDHVKRLESISSLAIFERENQRVSSFPRFTAHRSFFLKRIRGTIALVI